MRRSEEKGPALPVWRISAIGNSRTRGIRLSHQFGITGPTNRAPEPEFIGTRPVGMGKWESSAVQPVFLLSSSYRFYVASFVKPFAALSIRFTPLTLAFSVLVGLAPGYADAAVEVQTTDGRKLSGVVDARTDAQQLWLRLEEEGIILSTSVEWNMVGMATIDGREVTAEELRQQANQLASPQAKGFLVEYGPALKSIQTQDLPDGVGRITSLEIEARLVNLDRTVEPDGFEIAIAAIDDLGQQVPVRGNLYIRLQGERNVHHSGRIRFEDLERWSQPVSPHDFEDGVAVYAVKFRDFAPEFDDELRPEAQLNVRLGVFGQGNYSATVPVLLWEFSPFRDRLQMFEGSRFFRDEVTRRPRHLNTDPPGIYRKVWRQGFSW